MATSNSSTDSFEDTDYTHQIESYCKSKGWQYSREGEWLRLLACPICGSDARKPFALNTKTGAGKCHRCGFLGGLSTLKMNQGDLISAASLSPQKKFVKPPQGLWKEYHDALMQNQVALKYLKERRFISVEQVQKYRLGFDSKNKRFTFPYFEKGELISIKYKWVDRVTGKKDMLRWTDGQGGVTKAALYGVDFLSGSSSAVVCEGEEDCIVLDMAGVSNVVSVPNGADGCVGPFLDALEHFNEIIVVMDDDEVGQRGARKLTDALGKERCRLVIFPKDIEGDPKDPTDYMKVGRIHELVDAIKNAPVYTHDKVAHVSEFLPELRDDFLYGDRSRGVSTGYPAVDNLVGGRRPGEFTVIFGGTGSGKSTFANNLALNWASKGEAVLLGSFEFPRRKILEKFVQMIAMKWYRPRDDLNGQSMTIDDFDRANEVMLELPIFMVNVFGAMEVDDYLSCVSYAKRRLNANIAILDHLHFMLSIKRQEDTNIVIDRAVRKLKTAAIDYYMSIIAVAHPRKGEDDSGIYSVNDLKGSSSIQQEADNIWLVWRDRNRAALDPRVGRAKLISLKSRGEEGGEGEVELGLVHAGQRFVDTTAPTLPTIEVTNNGDPEDAQIDDF